MFIHRRYSPATSDNGRMFCISRPKVQFAMDHRLVKVDIETKLEDLLTTTSNLPVRPKSNLKILRLYIISQLSFELKTCNISTTWKTEHLDSKICNAVRSWLELPISTCVAEVLALPLKKGGHGIRSLKTTAQILRLGQRIRLRSSRYRIRLRSSRSPEMGDNMVHDVITVSYNR